VNRIGGPGKRCGRGKGLTGGERKRNTEKTRKGCENYVCDSGGGGVIDKACWSDEPSPTRKMRVKRGTRVEPKKNSGRK